VEQVRIQALYSGYLEKQEADISHFRSEEGLIIPDSLDYDSVASLSTEARERLKHHRPMTLGAAKRIPGITPAALVILLGHIKDRNSFRKSPPKAA
jgi:tRNA uridine 5-carboxymethylaminomethyl modification enzyme